MPPPTSHEELAECGRPPALLLSLCLCLAGLACDDGAADPCGDCEGLCEEGVCRCLSDKQCDEGEICSDGECTAAQCSEPADCDSGVCSNARCIACLSDDHCQDSRVCFLGVCRERECDSDDECDGRMMCQDGVCARCGVDNPCDGGLLCVDGLCERCAAHADCGDGFGCAPQGRCLAICETAEDCASSPLWTTRKLYGCRDHRVVASCESSFIAGVCDGAASAHAGRLECDPCLRASGGCAAGQSCEAGSCTCNDNADCGALACIDGLCERCNDDAECDCGHYCEAGRCHSACSTDDDCDRGRCQTESGRCVLCLSDSDCGGSRRCYRDGCVAPCPDAECTLAICHDNGRCDGCEECGAGPPPARPVDSCPVP